MIYSACLSLRPPRVLRPPLDFWGRVSPGRSHSFRFEFGLGEKMSVSADRQKLQAAPETNGSQQMPRAWHAAGASVRVQDQKGGLAGGANIITTVVQPPRPTPRPIPINIRAIAQRYRELIAPR